MAEKLESLIDKIEGLLNEIESTEAADLQDRLSKLKTRYQQEKESAAEQIIKEELDNFCKKVQSPRGNSRS